jgi:predicted dehydrogenase
MPEEISRALIQVAVVAILGCGPIIAAALHGCLRRIEHKLDINTAVTKQNMQMIKEAKTELKARQKRYDTPNSAAPLDPAEERLNP